MRTASFGLFVCLSLCTAVGAASASSVPPTLYNGLQWRLVGPHRAGWATTGTGVPGQPETFYIGTAGGGVWKTTNAGRTWRAVFDGVGSSSIGAVAVAPSDPSVVYAGTGQVAPRYDIQAGDGVYRSADGGKTWHAAGLAHSRHIGRILVDRKDPDTALAAAVGPLFGPGGQRGVYRTTDGGRHWTRTLFIDDDTGVVDLASDPQSPEIVYAAAWEWRNYPWLSYFTPVAGPHSGLYKSTDGGLTWKHIAGNGWPSGALGRIGLAVAPGTHGQRVYAAVDSQQSGGIYSSGDGGAHWQRVNPDPGLADWYFDRLAVVPGKPDSLYLTGRSLARSDDGGRHFTIVKGSPGGDDYHDIWIDPSNPERMLTSSDQGAAVTVDGGKGWSSWYNQPTGQFYHVATDDRFPYWIYAGQQDNGTVGISSRSDYGAISFRDWHPVGGDERDYDIPDPRDPQIVYGSGLGGHVSRFDGRTGQVQVISPWPESSYGARPTTVRNRYTWITPIAVSKLKPYPLYLGAQHLFMSTDQGSHWTIISPDLTGKRQHAGDCAGDVPVSRARACGYGVIYSIGLSPHDVNEVWVGTDDGLVQLTRDGGKHWHDVTPKGLPDWARIDTVDVSASAAGTAYIAIDMHRLNDPAPLAYRTHDHGKTWTKISDGLPADHYVSVVRADPVRAGLLYAGTDIGVYVSFDDGGHWQALQANLPTAWVRDLAVHDDDLIAGTQGRAIWVLDDLGPLREAAQVAQASPAAHLFAPATAIRVRRDENRDTPLPPSTPLGQNPPAGAVLDYYLAAPAKGPVTLKILDSHGKPVRSYSSEDKPEHLNADRYFAAEWVKPSPPLATSAGEHRLVWDLHYTRPRARAYDYSIAAVYGDDAVATPQGPLALPGRYEIVLSVDGKEYRQSLNLKMDPRVHVARHDLEAQFAMARSIEPLLEKDYVAYAELKAVRKQLADAREQLHGKAGADATVAMLDAFDKRAVKLEQGGDGQHGLKDLGSLLGSLLTAVDAADRAPTGGQRAGLKAFSGELDAGVTAWDAMKAAELAHVNQALKSAGAEPVTIPAADAIQLEDTGDSKDLP